MHNLVARLLLYRDLESDSILMKLSAIFQDFHLNRAGKEELIPRIHMEMKRLLDLATVYGFDKNLWHNYLTFLLMTNENPFSLICEKVGAPDGTVNHFAKKDFRIFKELFDFRFDEIEKELDIDCFSIISDYRAIIKKEKMYQANVSERVRELSLEIEEARDENAVFDVVTRFYQIYGVGMFGLHKAFRIKENEKGLDIFPIHNMDKVMLNDLIGYDMQKKNLIENTKAFVQGQKANNVLLFGDSGTGKSTCVKAIVNEYYEQGLRMIEIYKHQFKDLSTVIAKIKNRNYRFIIFMDDLSFEEFEIEYKFLKAVIEGGVETKPDHVLIYATSNRRHIIKETWSDKNDMMHENGGELHKSDTVQEKHSLVHRFGVTISFDRPSQKEYFRIVKELAKRESNLNISEEELIHQANQWELSHGGRSGRTAVQFIRHLVGVI